MAKAARAECFLASTFLGPSRVPLEVSLIEAIAWRVYKDDHVCLVQWGENTTCVILIKPHTYYLLSSFCWLYCTDLPAKPMLYRTDKRGWSVQLPGVCRAHSKPVKIHNLSVSSSFRVIAWGLGDKGKLVVMLAEFPKPINASEELVAIITAFVRDMSSEASRGSLVFTTAATVKLRTIAPGKRGSTLAIVNSTHEKNTPTFDSVLESVTHK